MIIRGVTCIFQDTSDSYECQTFLAKNKYIVLKLSCVGAFCESSIIKLIAFYVLVLPLNILHKM